MNLTDGERLLVVMLAEVMEAMGLNREIDPTLVKRLAINKDDWAIKNQYSGIFDSEAPSPEEVEETYELLSMWSFIEYSLRELEGDEADEAKHFHWTEFKGFDGNNDPHHGIAHTIINDLEQFDEFKGRGLNSHSRATLPRYRAMRVKFDAYMRGNSDPLSFDALKDLLN